MIFDDMDDNSKFAINCTLSGMGTALAGSSTGSSLSSGSDPFEFFEDVLFTIGADSLDIPFLESAPLFDALGELTFSPTESANYSSYNQAEMMLYAVTSTFTSGGGVGGVIYIIVVSAEGLNGTSNALAYDRVEKNAHNIYNTFSYQKENTILGNASIIAADENVFKELKNLLLTKNKNNLINELEALKEFKKDESILKLVGGKKNGKKNKF